MSLILLNDLVFQYTEEGHLINKEICLFFLISNSLSIFSCSLYLYIYKKIPHYQNNSNSLTLILVRANLISGISYFLFYSEFYLRNPSILTVIMKIVTLVNPLVIFTYYFWSACLTHNIYVTFYNYAKNLDKRVKFYRYQLIIYLFIFYIFTMFSIKFKEKQLKSKNFSFIENYHVNYIIFFYILGLFIIIYIISRLYYIIIIKSHSFSLTTPDERTLIIKKLFQSLIFRHIIIILYFLFTFIPVNLMMIMKFVFGFINFENFYLNFITMTLISFYGCFILLVKLNEPIMRNFILSIILCNKEYIKDYEPLIKKDNTNISNEDLTESFNDEKDILLNVYKDLDKSFMTFCHERRRMECEPIVQNNKYISFNLGNKYELYYIPGDKQGRKFSQQNIKNYSMKNFDEIKEEKDSFKKSNFHANKKDKKNNNSPIKEEEKKENDIHIINEFNIDNLNINDENNNNNTALIRNNTLNDSIHEIERKYTVDEIYEADKSSINNSSNNEGRNTINPIDQQINLRGSNFGLTKKETIDDKEQDKLNQRSITNLNDKALGLNNKIIGKTNTVNLTNELRKKRYIFHRNKKSTDFIYESKCQKLISPKRVKVYSKKFKNFYQEEISGYALLNYHLEINENIQRMIAISICINNDRKYDNQNEYQQFYYSPLPWKNTNFYKEKTQYMKYNDNNFPSWLNIKDDPRFKGLQIQVLSYSPFVFHHLRLMDKISIDDILKSLDIKKNLKIINEAKVSGGRGNNSIFRSWDKNLIIKTIDKNEKNLLINKMLEEYHARMRDTKSILSHIYGIFKIEIGDKGKTTVMLQRNMNDLFLDSNILTFDLKGSTVDRQSIKEEDIDLKKKTLFNKYKNIILKDVDLKITDIKIELNPYDGKNILLSICNDSIFLQKYDVTDYSLLIFINKYNKQNLEKHIGNPRIMPSADNNYIFNFSIIDYLGTFNLEKKGEKLMKNFVGIFRNSKDTNFSVQNPQNYGIRFRKFAKKIIIYEKEDNDNDNFSS